MRIIPERINDPMILIGAFGKSTEAKDVLSPFNLLEGIGHHKMLRNIVTRPKFRCLVIMDKCSGKHKCLTLTVEHGGDHLDFISVNHLLLGILESDVRPSVQ